MACSVPSDHSDVAAFKGRTIAMAVPRADASLPVLARPAVPLTGQRPLLDDWCKRNRCWPIAPARYGKTYAAIGQPAPVAAPPGGISRGAIYQAAGADAARCGVEGEDHIAADLLAQLRLDHIRGPGHLLATGALQQLPHDLEARYQPGGHIVDDRNLEIPFRGRAADIRRGSGTRSSARTCPPPGGRAPPAADRGSPAWHRRQG